MFNPGFYLFPPLCLYSFIIQFSAWPSLHVNLRDTYPIRRSTGYIAYNPFAKAPTYGYVPSLAAGIDFIVVFFLSLVIQTVRVARRRK